jgi:Monogalactosyldiacylglycerol (MGDG) synthase
MPPIALGRTLCCCYILLLALSAFLICESFTPKNALYRYRPVSSHSMVPNKPITVSSTTPTPPTTKTATTTTTTTTVVPSATAPSSSTIRQSRCFQRSSTRNDDLSNTDDDNNEIDQNVLLIQILMSDTGGGHRASANAIRDALRRLHGGQDDRMIQCDVVDIYTEYGPIWPYNDYPNQYKQLAANPWAWQLLYTFSATEFGMALTDFLLNLLCYDAFQQCIQRTTTSTMSNRRRRADMVVSVHPLTQTLPLKIVRQLDAQEGRHTPFCTVVTDLGSAHPTWFHPGYVLNGENSKYGTSTKALFHVLTRNFIVG